MAYRGLTAIGANYLATRLAQELPVEITRVQIGAGTPIGNPGDVSELQNYKLDAKILKKSQENNTLEITIQVVNEDVDQGFYLKEIGVFVNDDTEKLYWYCNEDNAQYIPAKTDSAIAFEIDIKMEVTNIESPIMNWSGKGTWIDKDYLEEVLKNHVVNNLTEQSATKALAANQGVVLDNKDVGIMGGRDGKFPLTAATKGNIYLLESTQKYYICINDYDGIQISVPNANFEELSVYTNRSKLDNLGTKRKTIYYTDLNNSDSGWQYSSSGINNSTQSIFKINISDIKGYNYLNILTSHKYYPSENKKYIFENLIKIENIMLGFKQLILTPSVENNSFILPLVAELNDDKNQILIKSYFKKISTTQECYIQQIYACLI